MQVAESGWGYYPIDIAHSQDEAEEKWHEWQERAKTVPGSEVRVMACRNATGAQIFILCTDKFELVKTKPGWQTPPRELYEKWNAVTLRTRSFRLQQWESQPALVSKDSRTLAVYEDGADFDRSRWDLVPDAWDHEHCNICMAHICNEEDHGFQKAYFDGEGTWVCPPCYQEHVEGWVPVQLQGI